MIAFHFSSLYLRVITFMIIANLLQSSFWSFCTTIQKLQKLQFCLVLYIIPYEHCWLNTLSREVLTVFLLMIKPPQMMLLFYITGEVYTKSGIDSLFHVDYFSQLSHPGRKIYIHRIILLLRQPFKHNLLC